MLFHARALRLVVFNFIILCTLAASLPAQPQAASVSTPTEIVREFYKRLRERRFREALMLSVYRPAVEELDASELDDLRTEFEAIAASVPAQVEITGEQTTGETATVFMKIQDDGKTEVQPVTLMRAAGAWVVGDAESAQAVKRFGKKFFFELRIETHHAEVAAMMQRIAQAQLAYSLQNAGLTADMPTLIREGLLPKDIETSHSTGYRFRITPSADRRTFTAGAEPARYNRTGRLSFAVNAQGMESRDALGKPIEAASKKK